MFKIRLLSGAVLLLGMALLIFLGSAPLWAASLLVGLTGLYELNKALGTEKTPLCIAGFAVTAAYYVLILFKEPALRPVTSVLFLAVCVFLAVYVARFPGMVVPEHIFACIGIVYVGLMSSCLYMCRMMDDGIYKAWLIVLSSWGSDTLAYCAGMLFGKRHPFPLLSPKKTIAGCVGGIIGSALLGAVLALVLKKGVLLSALVCAAGAVCSETGDLAASAIKRQHNIKDYGNLIPGHGGVMDRFDSTLVAGGIIYSLLCWFSFPAA